MTDVKLLMKLTENISLVPPRDPRGLVRVAVEAEAAGIDGVMRSEHVLLGPEADALGVMPNLRDHAAPGNRAPGTAWPSSIILLSAIARATTTLRLVAGAFISPRRQTLLLAKELGTLDLLSVGRLVVLPTVSWSQDEYTALGDPFGERGESSTNSSRCSRRRGARSRCATRARTSPSATSGSSPVRSAPRGRCPGSAGRGCSHH